MHGYSTPKNLQSFYVSESQYNRIFTIMVLRQPEFDEQQLHLSFIHERTLMPTNDNEYSFTSQIRTYNNQVAKPKYNVLYQFLNVEPFEIVY